MINLLATQKDVNATNAYNWLAAGPWAGNEMGVFCKEIE